VTVLRHHRRENAGAAPLGRQEVSVIDGVTVAAGPNRIDASLLTPRRVDDNVRDRHRVASHRDVQRGPCERHLAGPARLRRIHSPGAAKGTLGGPVFYAGLERRPVRKAVFDRYGMLSVCELRFSRLPLELAQPFLGLFPEMLEIWSCG
jgi:hypothetical protein